MNIDNKAVNISLQAVTLFINVFMCGILHISDLFTLAGSRISCLIMQANPVTGNYCKLIQNHYISSKCLLK